MIRNDHSNTCSNTAVTSSKLYVYDVCIIMNIDGILLTARPGYAAPDGYWPNTVGVRLGCARSLEVYHDSCSFS